MASVTTAPYGSWKSPISSQMVSESSVAFQEIRLDGDRVHTGTFYWSELRYEEGGRYVICSQKAGEDACKEWTPKDFNARTRVHEYGGGAFFVHGGHVYFSNFSDQRMYLQKTPDDAPEPITPNDCGWRYADGQYHATKGLIYCIREDHSLVEKKEAKEPKNTVVCINPNTQEQNVLAEGCDFYSGARVSPDGKKIAWIQWNHPNMPWDNTSLRVADLNEKGDGVVEGSEKEIAGGCSLIQPSWTPYGELLYISDKTNWWNLYHLTTTGNHDNLLPRDAETGSPHWVFGHPNYAVDQGGSGKIVTVTKGELGVVNMLTREYHKIDTCYTSHSKLALSQDGHTLYCDAGSPTQFSCIVKINTENGEVTVIKKSKESSLDTGYFSIPTEISWDTSDGGKSYGYFYPPQNKDFNAPEGTLPPLLVKAHGGPTGQTMNVLNLKNQYFTSRGMAILDVNYRGSTGYGTEYRNMLKGKWGIYDMDDCCSGAESLANPKDGSEPKVNKDMLCIDGGSAGGYTTLACLTFRKVFKAGASHYGIGDLGALARDTHKFESRYLDLLICPYEGDGIKVYEERSPINHVEKLNCAMALFQGDEDKAIPPNQAEEMYEAVKKKGHPTMYILFKGEQHGFRKAENIQKALDGEFYFFAKVFGYTPADTHISFEIENLKE
ncbi:hypothetical protein FSP39_019244 [Pinctada imbricata]|uniref:Peptidase S9 prolyl oligopeptidase catalytic domain-containing protein n=1 Tax=Pinctada imbricata TaxID=66713 RepID=A0AA88YCC2_PINIB|nr:hypothetical protein FSP39_019244 [Pinctada imbricata]